MVELIISSLYLGEMKVAEIVDVSISATLFILKLSHK